MNNVTSSRRTALIVEDDPALLDVLHEVLTVAGFETTALHCGRPAMRLLAKQRFDVLLVDVNLPDMSGMIVCDTARERYEDQIVILVITGLRIQDRRVSSLQLGADDFLGKPFDPKELVPVSRVSCVVFRRLTLLRNLATLPAKRAQRPEER